MSTHDVPGANPANRDVLATGCWSETDNGDSLIHVESTEGGRVIFSMFDLTRTPVIAFRHAMPEELFKKSFSWQSGEAVTTDKWVWHDKTPFPWDRVIREGLKPGADYALAQDQISAAQRVADALHLQGEVISQQDPTLKAKSVRKMAKAARRFADMLEQMGA
jgi:hypothetical protein